LGVSVPEALGQVAVSTDEKKKHSKPIKILFIILNNPYSRKQNKKQL
jgi:hypothetical protein